MYNTGGQYWILWIFFIRHDWKLKTPTVGVKIFSSILAEYSALTQVSNALYQPVSDSQAVKMEGNAGDEEGMFSDIRKDYSCFQRSEFTWL